MVSERLGQQFVVENRSGAGSNIGTEAAVRAPSDGYTLLLVSTANAINTTLFDKLNFVFLRDIAPVAGILSLPYVMVVHPSVPAKTVPEFIAYAKTNPGKLNLGSPGIGTGPHVAGELFKVMTGVDMVHVPYRGGAPRADGSAWRTGAGAVRFYGRVDRAHQGRQNSPSGGDDRDALGGAARCPERGRVPPSLRGELDVWSGAPANTPAEIVNKLNKEINAGLADPKMKARLADLGGTVLAGSSTDFSKLIAEETEKWAKVIRAANIKPE